MRKLTYEEVKEVFESKGNKLISKGYHGNKIPLEYICDCGELDKKTIHNFKYGQRCRKCGEKKVTDKLRRDLKEIIQYFKDNDCELIGDYKNANTPINFKCKCGKKDKKRIREFKEVPMCSECGYKKALKTKKEKYNYAQKYKELYEAEGYEMLTPYIKATEDIMVKCPEGHVVPSRPANFKTGFRCRECSGNQKKSIEEVRQYFENEGYQLISKNYKDAFSKLNYICPSGHEEEMSWDNFRAGKRCPSCHDSKGEKRIEEYLIKKGYNYQKQFRFKECKYKKPLPFDFVIFENDKKSEIDILIEFDGQQHFHAYEIFGGDEGLEYNQKRDQIKDQYCETNNIPLIRIPYWDFENIEEILDKELPKYIKQTQLN